MSQAAPILLHNIPRAFTAIAEWLACMLYISQYPYRRKQGIYHAFYAGMLVIQTAFLTLTANVPLILWIPCMAAAVGLMFLLLYVSCDMTLETAGYYCVRAFLLAEFAASLEWQLFYYTVYLDRYASRVTEWLYLLAVYTFVFGAVYFMERRWLSHSHSNSTTFRELISAVIIGVAVFSISNLSFNDSNTPFSTNIITDIFTIRTLVDLGGLAILYAYHIQRSDLRSRYELETTNMLLQSQYAQYQQSKESIDLINRKYHDLKHQIGVLRMESDSGVRNAYLDRMEDEIRSYEAQNKTGNAVLDTILTSKALTCQKSSIALTCVADGHLLDFLETMDLCTIFGNALDNAIEYEQSLSDPEKRMIHLSVSRQKGFVAILISNYFEGQLEFEDGIPSTTKSDRAFHGYGVRSIRQTVRKYGGSMAIDLTASAFQMKLLIPLKS